MKQTKLQKRRQAAGLSQSQLAERTGISLRTLQHYEIGDRSLRKAAIETGLTLAKALKCNVEDLID